MTMTVSDAQMIRNFKRAIVIHKEKEDWTLVRMMEERLTNEERSNK